MRCRSCDCDLTDFEATRRYSSSGDYIDLCSRCFAPIMDLLDTSERFDLFDPDKDIIDFDVVGEETPSTAPSSSDDEGNSADD